MADTITKPTAVEVEAALAQAHLPSLLMALIHLTGDEALIDRYPRPVYDFFGDGQGGLPAEAQADIRARAKDAILAHLGGAAMPPPPAPALVRRMMDYVAGADIPERYEPFLREELGLGAADAKRPHWDSPKLKDAAAKLSVLIIGAGMSGLLAAIRLKQAGIAFTIIEKNADVGGTWFENSYPGCRVDTQNHLYSYSFEPNHLWPQHYSTQNVLLAYFRGVADKYDLRRHIKFETEVIEARFDEKSATWKTRVRGKDGAEETIETNAVISAVGQLNRPRLPDIKGRDTFKGPAFHSADWRHDVDLKGKRVAVIGTGASAFQFVPEIAREVKELLVFQRTPPWLAPTPNYHDDVGEGMKWLLERVPFYDKWYRFWLFWTMTDGILPMVKADPEWNGADHTVSQMNFALRQMLVEKLREQTGGNQTLLEAVVPDYPVGGKRALRDNGVWIAALRRDNVRLVTDAITEITPEGLKTADGARHDVDVIIYGTGFYASRFLSPMKILGRGGVELHDKWNGDARAYLGMTAPGFPNFFMIYGPNTNIVVNGSIIFFSEASVRYILESLKLLAETGARSMEVRGDVHDAFNQKVDAENRQMAWGAEGVTSWYKNEKGRVSQNWPFALVDYWEATLKPNPQDFVLQ
jgi:4-hydroxyacetophenone monooxygenase